jgi:signal transduction histidine kinase
MQVFLLAADGSQMPVQISLRPLAKNGENGATVGMVVTDLTQARRSEEMLRALANRVVQAQETERGRVALELHDHITQLLCAVLARSQALANGLAGCDDALKREAENLREMLGTAAEEVERISRNLRPGLLEHMGLAVVLRETSKEFTKRTGVPLKLTCGRLTEKMPADVELALYRILQEALKNMERHAQARHVTVRLTQPRGFVLLEIIDDGVGFDAEGQTNRRKGKNLLGLLGMLERATYVGGTLTIQSSRGEGTQIEVRIPLTTGSSTGKFLARDG